MSELAEKRRRLRAILDAESLDALVLRRPANLAWLSCGGRTHVVAVQETAVAAVVVSRDGEEVVAPVNEAPRLEEEELAALDARFRPVPWDADLDAELPTGERIGTDTPSAGRRDVSAAVVAARRSLTPEEADRYRTLGRDAAEALTATLGAASPEWTEHEAAAQTARACLERGIDPIVLLVAGADRLPRHRHPLPTAGPLGRLAMVVVCARRAGLVASLTRVVSFGGLGPELTDVQERLLRVDVAFNRATRAGATVGDVFRAGTAAYGEHGFDPDEWRLHHQGGPTGYEPRDELATGDSEAVVEPRQAFAWNPSVPSLKCEDTVLATDGPPELLTVDDAWPTETVAGLMRPVVLER
jgi:Xaa-Pro aminopeptidase